ncbi:MAG: LysR family transcriptional regulator [Clostridia bacterium]|nr:LysR family transcriptional regulator [Clostridia bacterium]
MDLLQLRYFCHAAQTENFSQTAQFFYVPVASVSQSVKRLENELGARLFNRNVNKIMLSEAGLTFYTKISQALDFIDDAKKSVQDANMQSAGKIKLLVHTCRRIVTQTVETFRTHFPSARFIIHHAKEKAGGDYDFVISDQALHFALPQSSLLLSEKIMLACHKSHPLANRSCVSALDLKDEEFISMTAGNSLHDVLTDISKRAGFTPKIAIQSDDPFYVRKYLDEGLGISLVPAVSWRGTFSENIRLVDLGAYTRDTYVWHDTPALMPALHRKFLSYLKTAFKNEK